MPLAVTERLDPALSDRIEGMRAIVEANDLDLETLPNYPPHITLAAFEAGAPLENVSRVLSALCSDLGIFPGRPSYVFLAPVPTRPLLDLHEQIVSALPADLVHHHHAVGCWVPHITIAAARGNPAGVVEAACADWEDFRGAVTGLDIVSFPPVEILAAFPLLQDLPRQPSARPT